jgi:hypothetical protein
MTDSPWARLESALDDLRRMDARNEDLLQLSRQFEARPFIS